MGRIITDSYAISKGKSFFNDKKATTLAKLNNLSGEEIEKGSTITINGRGSTKLHLNITCDTTGVVIRNIWCGYLELID